MSRVGWGENRNYKSLQKKGHASACPFHALVFGQAFRAGSGCQSLRRFRERRLRSLRSFSLERGILLLLLAAYLDAALQHRAVFHADPLGEAIAVYHALTPNIYAVGALDVARPLAHDHNLPGYDVGLHRTIAADCYAMIGEHDLAFDPAINIERFRASNLAFDDQ